MRSIALDAAAKSEFRPLGLSGASRVVFEARKRYGMLVADNGSNWLISGAADRRWNDSDLKQLKQVPGSAVEAVAAGPDH